MCNAGLKSSVHGHGSTFRGDTKGFAKASPDAKISLWPFLAQKMPKAVEKENKTENPSSPYPRALY
jgi:hypothetical protein